MNDTIQFFLIQSVLVYSLLFFAHALHRKITIAPFYVLLGAMVWIMWWVTDAGVRVEVFGLSLLVGSTVYYSAVIVSIFLVYLFDGPQVTRRSMAIVISISIVVPLTSLAIRYHAFLDPGTSLVHVPVPDLRINAASILATAADLVFLALCWDFLVKKTLPLPLWLRSFLTLLAVMWFDVILFGLGAFLGTEFFWTHLKGTAITRFCTLITLFPFLWMYIRWQNSSRKITVHSKSPWQVLGDVTKIKRELHTAKQDLEEQKKTEDIIRESELRYRNLFEYAPIALWEEDFSEVKEILNRFQADGITDIGTYLDDNPSILSDLFRKIKIVDVNRAALELYQAESKSNLLENLEKTFTSESFDTFKAEMVAIAENQSEFESEAVVQTLQGEKRNIILKLIAQPDRQDYSQVLITTVDITENKIVDEALKSSEHLLQESQKVAGIGSYVLDVVSDRWESSIVLDELFDIDPEYPKDSAGWLQIVHPEDLKMMQEYFIGNVLTDHEPFNKEYRIKRMNDGQERWVHGLGKLEFNAEGNPVQMFGTIQDISERKRSEQQLLERADKVREAEESRMNFEKQLLQTQKLESLGVLAGGIAHDFNNILMGILGYADLALSTLNPQSPAREYVEGISSSSRKAAALIKQMLAYSGRGKFTLEPIDLNHLIEDTVQMLMISISKNAVMKFKYASEPIFMEGDPSQIRQIIMNLVINASEAIEKQSGVIALSTGQMYCDQDYINETEFEAKVTPKEPLTEGMYAFVEVSDTGMGMSKNILMKIFDPFFTTKFTGRGLGLSAVVGIVNGHHGMIKIYSEVQKGTTFKILFPFYKTTEAIRNNNYAENSHIEDWQGQGTFLIADDEEAIRAVSKHMLRKMGFEVLTVEDGREAIEVFKKHADEIVGVLLDLTMPHKDGAQVFQEIRKINSKVKVILSSGYNEQDATQQFVGKGLAGFIQKPYVSADLARKIEEVFRR